MLCLCPNRTESYSVYEISELVNTLPIVIENPSFLSVHDVLLHNAISMFKRQLESNHLMTLTMTGKRRVNKEDWIRTGCIPKADDQEFVFCVVIFVIVVLLVLSPVMPW